MLQGETSWNMNMYIIMLWGVEALCWSLVNSHYICWGPTQFQPTHTTLIGASNSITGFETIYNEIFMILNSSLHFHLPHGIWTSLHRHHESLAVKGEVGFTPTKNADMFRPNSILHVWWARVDILVSYMCLTFEHIYGWNFGVLLFWGWFDSMHKLELVN